jgi:hypothetical protein
MPYRDFDAARREADRGTDPPAFTLGGDEFVCIPKVPLALSFELMEAPEPGTSADAVQALTKFLRRVLVDEDNVQRFDKILARVDDAVTPDDIVEVTNWLGELYTGRPFEKPADSGPSSPTNGSTSSPPNSEAVGATSWNAP